MIVRINDVGQAEAIDYRNFQYRPRKLRTSIIFRAGRSSTSADIASLSSGPDELSLLPEWRRSACRYRAGTQGQTSSRHTSRKARSPYVDVEVKNIVLDDLRQSPYSARIEFEKVYTNPADHTELKRERWTASVTYVFRET